MTDPHTEPPEGQCAFFLTKKKRFCRFRPNKDQKYCAEHAYLLGVQLERKRVVCPLNPKHSCYEDCLEKHLKKCNSRKRKEEDYFEEGINAGSDEGDSLFETKMTVKATDTERLKEMLDRVNQLYEEHIGSLERDERSHWCLKEELENPTYGLPALRHRRQQASLIGQMEKLGLLKPGNCYVEMGAGKGQLSHWVRKAVCDHDDAAFLLVDRSSVRYKMDSYHKEEEKVKFERIKIDIEHLNLGKVPMIKQSNRHLVAIGKHLCGAATDLALRCVMETLPNANTSVSSPPRKKQRMESLTDNKSENLEKEFDSGTSSVADSCHAVSCDVNAESNSEVNIEKPINGPKKCQLAGLVIALCCHHRCTWKAYVGKSFMNKCGLSAADFNLLTRLSSWAVCGWLGRDGSFEKSLSQSQEEIQREKIGASHEVNDAEESVHKTEDLVMDTNKMSGLQLSEKEKETIGWRCKRLIDYGRVCYLHDHGMQSMLKEYINKQQTPENVALVSCS